MAQLFANNAVSTLAAAITASATTIVLDPATANLFPQPVLPTDYFMLTLEDRTVTPTVREITRCTNRSGNSLTVVRAQEGTTGVSFPAGAAASLRITAGSLTTLVTSILADLKTYPGVLRVITDLSATADADGVSYTDGQYGIYTESGLLYVRQAGVWNPAFAYSNLSGDFPPVAASDITGELTDSQIADVAAGKITGELTSDQIASLVTTKLSGFLTSDQISDLAAAKLTGQILSTQLSAGQVLTPALGAGVIYTNNLNAADILANYLKVQTAYVGTAQIIDASILSAKIGNAQVLNAHINNLAVDNLKVAGSAISTDKIVANAVSDVSSGGASGTAAVISSTINPGDTVVVQALFAADASVAQTLNLVMSFTISGVPYNVTIDTISTLGIAGGGILPMMLMASAAPGGADNNYYIFTASMTSGANVNLLLTRLQR